MIGPEGVERVVGGFNQAYSLDRDYRIAHHGEDMLPPTIGPMSARTIKTGVVYDQDDLRISAFEVDHDPIRPALGYRFDFGGRSVVVSGDTVKTHTLIEAAKGADLLFHDAMALGIVQMLEAARKEVGPPRLAKLLGDIQDYHAPTLDVVAVAREAAVRRTIFYHLVPALGNPMMDVQFLRGVPEDVVLAEDGMLFVLPRGNQEIEQSMLFER